jgi:hypothetical protein
MEGAGCQRTYMKTRQGLPPTCEINDGKIQQALRKREVE